MSEFARVSSEAVSVQAERRVRVMHVTTVPASLQFLRGQAEFMRERGYELSAVSSPLAGLREHGEHEGIAVHGVPMSRSISPLDDLVALIRLWRHIERERPEIVHAHTPKGGLLGTLAAALAGVPIRIYHMRGLRLMGVRGPTLPLLAAVERLCCAVATDVLCVSHSVRNEVVERGLCPAAKIRVLADGSGQGVDGIGRFDPDRLPAESRAATRARLGLPADALVYGFVGRLVREKGLEQLAEAWPLVRRELGNAHLVLVGDFEGHDPISDRHRAALEEDDSVVLHGFSKDTPALYAAMDVVVLPSHREGFPNVPLEAASMGLPVVSTTVPGCRDAVADGVTGLLVPAHEVGPLAEALLSYGHDPELRLEHGRAGRQRILKSFLRERIWAAIAARYERLLSESDV